MTSIAYPEIVGKLHKWLESTRVRGGYGGPVSHWWRHSLLYTGVGLDWRYEGIIHGYLNLYTTTGERRWLDVASRAGRDLVDGQRRSGNYFASAFERNPEPGGTPHEACASAALLRLARTRRADGLEWERFADTARRNLDWHVEALWTESDGTFSDTVGMRSYVPNKIASTVDAFLELERLTDAPVEQYVEPALETIRSLQVESGEMAGAIHQLSVPDGGAKLDGDGKFFPLYIARCIPPLAAAGERLGNDRFVETAVAAGEFLARVESEAGHFPQVVYETGDVNEYPRWVAGVGDILRAYDTLRSLGYDFETAAVEEWLRSGFDRCGAFTTADGFEHVLGRDGRQLEDVLHVVGWNDKAFRWLSTHVDEVVRTDVHRSSTRCVFEGTPGRFVEWFDRIEFVPERRGGTVYQWDKESRWAERG